MTVENSRFVVFSAIVALLCVGNSGCAFGPHMIEQTHGRYSAAVQHVEEAEFLKNIVRLRYVEDPQNLDITAIAAQYELAASAEARPFFSTEATSSPSVFGSFSALLPFAGLSTSTRPTVSLAPQDDGTSVRQFLTPISADTIVFLAQSGWPISSVMRIWMDRINGVPNWVPASGAPRDKPADFERFHRAAELLQQAQDLELMSLSTDERSTEMSGPLPPETITGVAVVEAAKAGFEFQPKPDGKTWALVKKNRRIALSLTAQGHRSSQIVELASILNLDPDAERFELVVASGVPDPASNPAAPVDEFRIAPRSTAQALFFLANGVEVPQSHVECGLVRMPDDGTVPTEATRGLFRVHCTTGNRHRPPNCAYVAVWYRNHWYYVDDRDAESKGTLLLMLQLCQLDFKRQDIGRVPALTLPVGR